MLTHKSIRHQRGSFLIEGLIAILIFSMGILAVMGLQAASIKHGIQAKYRADAGYFANQIVAQMMADKNNAASYDDSSTNTNKTAWLTEVAGTLPNGTGNITVAGSQVTISVNWRLPDEAQAHRYVAVTQVVY